MGNTLFCNWLLLWKHPYSTRTFFINRSCNYPHLGSACYYYLVTQKNCTKKGALAPYPYTFHLPKCSTICVGGVSLSTSSSFFVTPVNVNKVSI